MNDGNDRVNRRMFIDKDGFYRSKKLANGEATAELRQVVVECGKPMTTKEGLGKIREIIEAARLKKGLSSLGGAYV